MDGQAHPYFSNGLTISQFEGNKVSFSAYFLPCIENVEGLDCNSIFE